MSEFVAVLAFSWIPLAGALAFSLTAAPLGATLSLRDEILLGLALPPIGSAAVVGAVLAGVSPQNALALYLAALAAILTASLFLSARVGGAAISPRWRAGFLASVFCAGEAATILMSALSTRVEAHLQHMLRGELLAIGSGELFGFMALTAVLLALGIRFRGLVFALAIDEEGFNVRMGTGGRRTLLLFRALSAVLIAAGVMWVGPLLTLGLLAIPTMLWERSARGMAALYTGVTVVGFLGVLGGFVGSIALDVPPVPAVICALFAVGGAFTIIRRG